MYVVALFSMYQWYDWSQGETGLGRNENGTIIADDDWWDKHTQVLSSNFEFYS